MNTVFQWHNRRIITVLALLVVSSLLLQGCGAKATPAPTEAPLVQPTEAPIVQPTEAPLAYEGTLRVAMQPLVQIDPATISSDPEVFVANHVYDYLVDITSGNTIAPRLATSWTVSDDGLQYVFTLASGVKFHDGSPFSANDVVWTYNRLRNPDSGYPTGNLYKNIANIEATGDLEVTFTLSQPNPFFLFDLSDNHALVVKTDTQDFTTFNGTGPFKVVSYSPEDRIVMEANQDYFVDGQPKLAGLEVIFFNDQTAMVDALKSGDVDLTMAFSTDLYLSLKDAPGITRLEMPTNMFDVVRLRSDRAPGNNPKVIQAMKLAMDREAVFQLVMPGFGEIGRDSPIGPMYTQYFEELPLPARDVARARELLKEAGYPNGLKLDLHTPDTMNSPQLAVVLKEQWIEAGIDVNVMVEPESVYYGDNGWLEVDLGITNWGSRPYPQFYLDMMLTCDAQWNESHFCDTEFDQLAKTAGSTLNEAERVQAYHDIQRLLLDRGPIIINFFYTQVGAISDRFQGFEFKAFSGRSDVRNLSLVK